MEIESKCLSLMRRKSLVALVGLTALVFASIGMPAEADQFSPSSPYAVSVFGGLMTGNGAEDILTNDNVRFRHTYLLGIDVSRRIGGLGNNLDFEIEGQIDHH